MEHFDLIKTINIQLQKECEKYKSFKSLTKVNWSILKITPLYNFEIQKYSYNKTSQKSYLDYLSDELNNFLDDNLVSTKRNHSYIYECKFLNIELDQDLMKQYSLYPSIGIYVSSKNLETNITRITKILLISCINVDREKNYSKSMKDDSVPLITYNMVITNGDKDMVKEVSKWLRIKYDCNITDITMPPLYIYSLMILWTSKSFKQFLNETISTKDSKTNTNTTIPTPITATPTRTKTPTPTKKKTPTKIKTPTKKVEKTIPTKTTPTKKVKKTTTKTNSPKTIIKPKKKIKKTKKKDHCYDYANQEYDSDDYEHYAKQADEIAAADDESDREENLSIGEGSQDKVTDEDDNSDKDDSEEYDDDEEEEKMYNRNNKKRNRKTKPKISSKQYEFIYSFSSIMDKTEKKTKDEEEDEDEEEKKKHPKTDQSLQIVSLKIPSKTICEIISYCHTVNPNLNQLANSSIAQQVMKIIGGNFKKIIGISLDTLAFVQIVTSEASIEVSGKVKFFNNPFITLRELSTYV
ncbi:hypothetical protein ACTFIU_002063 [Dictyostelium citrinum]